MHLSEVLSLIPGGNLCYDDEGVTRWHLDVVGSEHRWLSALHVRTTGISAAPVELRQVQEVSRTLDLQACGEKIWENSAVKVYSMARQRNSGHFFWSPPKPLSSSSVPRSGVLEVLWEVRSRCYLVVSCEEAITWMIGISGEGWRGESIWDQPCWQGRVWVANAARED